MSQQAPRSRIYIGLFLLILLMVIPYFIGGLSGIVVALVFAALIAGLRMMVNPKWSFLSKALFIIAVLIVLFVVIYVFVFPHTPWLPVP